MSEADGHTGELRDIAYHVECLVAAVERIEKALAPQGSEREQVALKLFIHLQDCTAGQCYEQADAWIAERDRQRAQQAEREQGGNNNEQA